MGKDDDNGRKKGLMPSWVYSMKKYDKNHDAAEAEEVAGSPEEGLAMEQAAVNGLLARYFKNSKGMGYKDKKSADKGLEAVGG